MEADLLVILTDIDGLYEEDPGKTRTLSGFRWSGILTGIFGKSPGARFQPGHRRYEYEDHGGGGGYRGGHRLLCVINGENPELLYDLLEGREIGTRFVAKKKG